VSCELTQTVLHGYLDGELDAARAADFERHLLSCPECVASLEAQETLHKSIQSAALYERAPVALRQRLEAELGRPASSTRVIPMRSTQWQWLAIAAILLLVATLAWKLFPGLGGSSDNSTYASAIVDAHLRSLQPGHLEDVVSTDQHTVKPWFDGKLDFAPPVRDFAGDGFPLQGGRLDAIKGRTVAVLVYGRRKHIVNVFVWPTKESDSVPQSGTQLGYNWINWRKNGMEFSAVSDVSPSDLTDLQRLFNQ
jgi:anti-sigma factor (TIGR02949 family)